MTCIKGVYENLIYRKSPMADVKLALYVNLFLTAVSSQNELLQDGNI